jgi:hypothetical protein
MSQPPSTLGVIYCFARSGGTLLNQCLGCHPGNAVLSEVNPAGSYFDAVWQAEHWLGLIDGGNRAGIQALPYEQQIAALAARTTRAGRRLVVRDWSVVNFLSDVMKGVEPSGVLEQEHYLARTGLGLRRVVLSRPAEEIFHSLRSRIPQFLQLDAETFGQAYLAYARSVCDYPIVCLKDFTTDPKPWMRRICDLLDAVYEDDFPTKFAGFRLCTGNTTLAVETFSSTRQDIAQSLSSNGRPSHKLFVEADKLLGYDTH